MRILELTGEPIASGGQEMFIANVLRHIDMTDLHIDWLTLYYCDNDVYRNDVERIGGHLECLNFEFIPGKFRWDYVRPLISYLKRNHYDVVHIHSGSTTVLAFSSLAAKIAGVKRVIVHSHSTGVKKGLKYYLIKICTLPFLGILPNNYCACSLEAGEWKYPFFISKNKIKVIKNGIDLELFRPNNEMRLNVRTQLGFDDNVIVIGHVGRFSLTKNHPFILRVFRKLKEIEPQTKLLLIGDGELMDDIKSEASRMGIDKDVIFTGRVPDVHNYVQAMDVFIFPSLWEGFGLVGIEAQGVGVPVVASTCVPKIMKQSDDVKFLPLDNEDLWADAIIAFSKKERGDNVAQIRANGYDIEQTAQELRNMYLYK